MRWRALALLTMAGLGFSVFGEGGKTIEQKVLEAGDLIQHGIQSTAEKIDITLAGKKYTKKPNHSHAELHHLVTWNEGGRVRQATDFGLSMLLPNLERRWQLRFSSYDEERESHDVTNERVRTHPRERNYGAGLFFFEKLGKVKTSFLPRVQLKNPLEVSYTLRFETDSNTKPVRILPRLDLYADPNKGTGEFGKLEFRSDLTERLEASLANTEEYRDKDNLFTTQHVVALDYSLSDTQAVGLAHSFVSLNHPFHLDSYTFSLGYTQQIYPSRLSYSLSPFLLFAKGSRFKGNVGVSFSLNLIF